VSWTTYSLGCLFNVESDLFLSIFVLNVVIMVAGSCTWWRNYWHFKW